MRWKLVFVAAAVLVLAAVAAPVTTAVAQADVFRPAIEIAPAGRSADRPYAWTGWSLPSRQVVSQLQLLQMQARLPANVDQERRLSPGAIIGLICAITASSVALGVAFGLRRRIDRIAGPDPDKNDDE